MMTPKGKEKQAEVPERMKPVLGDETRHADRTYTPMRGEFYQKE